MTKRPSKAKPNANRARVPDLHPRRPALTGRLGSTFGMTAVGVQATPTFGPATQLRFRRSPWGGPAFSSFPLYNVDIGSLTYYGTQTVVLGAPALGAA
jgi:hypothetical protein